MTLAEKMFELQVKMITTIHDIPEGERGKRGRWPLTDRWLAVDSVIRVAIMTAIVTNKKRIVTRTRYKVYKGWLNETIY